MVLKKRIYDGGFHGLLPPVIPKAPRSLRKRCLRNKSSADGEISGFELLAAVADKLLQEQESESSTSSVGSKGKGPIGIHEEGAKHEPLEVNVDVKVNSVIPDHHDPASGAESELVAQPTNLDPRLKESPHSENDSGSDHASIVTNSGFVKKVNTSLIMEAIEDKPRNMYDVSVGYNRDEIHPVAVEKQSGGLTSVKTYNVKDGLKPCVHTGVSNKSYTSADLPYYKDRVRGACLPRDRGNVNINIRDDDDEKYFRYNNRNNTRLRAFGSRSRAGYRRMRKMMPSRYWKVARKLHEYELQNGTSGRVKSFYHKRKKICMREWFQADAAVKRRKLFHNSSKNSYIKEASNESMSNLVKFSIKSFKVPELYVEVPETETVGSLKRSVMEAVKAILHGKLHVGVVVQGKKVRDDNRTLQQSGISQNCNLETVGFTLESSLPEVSPFLAREETPSCNAQQWLSRPIIDGCFSSSSSGPPPLATSLDNHLEKNEESTTFAAEGTEVMTQEPVEDSKALVVVPPLDAEVLSVVPFSEKSSKRYEFSQRRTRRPFSVSEVEALVEAVEILGAGRWRDVKMRAFGDANHRTYVDLKDKWKTLVHTASISPQQRRGEPVPQNLLDRVLVAHAYWSQHQAKQPAKNQKPLEAQM
ncbi:putative Ubiquitin domain, SANT/Myb domain, Homeobox-like domain superfamily [Helianthus annuus]|uniref:Putative homeodomain-like, Ubiquitin-related domain protein n=1 Tax=Helianthus annuus TaxID=4232 RepID=A0A251U4G5_HELAN|nr:telomere repeat-binding protein 3 [Helianthus annuus]XP_021977108.1 telomere repeat-binding protein 3 [Helianthus annuus]XP_021977109.1 telomere repeat-binding protein 3 [Helianthus annuus]XP_035832521.1 telomere repeat-binding protein 3 [Helianthus annuus]XP_035832522.1 telomere repeat-binding protein 3 [Helianthus annuus]KAF5794882.1 putative Ubiquitin domain, SANT/Myb domain, Homeobox-like domain superfamily [Helianthus annuus]KAJ0718779.1 putative transcription factor MYB-HB-like famil